MAQDKGSDLDVFEGLTKKKKQPSIPSSEAAPASSEAAVPGAPETMRGGLGTSGVGSSAGASSRPLPPPKSVSSIPKPKPPPPKKSSAPPSSALPKPTPPPPKKAESESPALSIKPASVSSVFEEPSGSILPGHAVAELDWDDEEESTSVFDRSASDLFGDLAGKPKVIEAEDGSRRDVGKAAALLAMSGKAAKAIPSTAPGSTVPMSAVPMSGPASPMSGAPVPSAPVPSMPVPSMPVPSMPVPSAAPVPAAQPIAAAPTTEAMPRIPAPAPVPRDISDGLTPAPPPAEARAPHPSWAPGQGAAPAQGRSGASTAMILLSLIAVIAAAAGVFFYLRSSSAADVEIRVTHNGDSVEAASIIVDGREECKFAPCKLKLEPGERDIRVTSGNLAGRQEVTIEGGGKVQVTIPLGVSDDVAPPDSAKVEEPKPPPKLVLSSGMTDKDAKIEVFVNGESKGNLPLTLDDLEPGDVKLRFEGGEKYGKVEKVITLEPGKEITLDDINLPLLKVKVKFSLESPKAKVKLVSEDETGKKEESKLAFRANKAEKVLDTTKKWTVVAELEGYDAYEQVIDFDASEGKSKDGKELTFAVELKKEEEAPEPPPLSGPITPGPGPTPGPDPAPTPAKDFGFINANSRPPSKVIIDGRPMGGTPVMGHKVKPGSHSIVFKHPELGTRSTSVTVAGGETKTASVVFKTEKKPDPAPSKKKKKKKKKKK